MRRLPWDIFLVLLAGLGLGLVYSWVISPVRVIDAEPAILRADFKDQYRSVIAASYAVTGNLPRTQARLALLGDSDPIEALNAQAQRMLASGASGEQIERADQVAALAAALSDENNIGVPVPSLTPEFVTPIEAAPSFTHTAPVPASEAPVESTETPEIIEIQPTPTVSIPTPRPTITVIPTLGAPFVLKGQESICDSNLPDGLLQVIVLNPNRRQLAGAEIIITWEGGKEQFFTGFKPELGNGYADYIMSPNIAYAVQLARGSDVAVGITAPTCQTPSGESFFGGIKLTYQQP